MVNRTFYLLTLGFYVQYLFKSKHQIMYDMYVIAQCRFNTILISITASRCHVMLFIHILDFHLWSELVVGLS